MPRPAGRVATVNNRLSLMSAVMDTRLVETYFSEKLLLRDTSSP